MPRPIDTVWETFQRGMGDVDQLLALVDEKIDGAGRPAEDLYALKKSAVILTVTAWETYIEDVLRSEFKQRLQQATAPVDFGKDLEALAQAWLAPYREAGQYPSAKDLASWSGDGWKQLLRSRFDEELDALHTPSTKKVSQLTRRYLGVNVTAEWRWPGVNNETAKRRLNELIKLRGNLVHRSRDFWELDDGVRKKDVTRGITCVRGIALSTHRALGRST